MKILHHIFFAPLFTYYALTSVAQEPPKVNPFGPITNMLVQNIGGQWEENNGVLFGSEQLENGTIKYACAILQNLSAHPDALPSWEFRYFYCSAPCYILAASDEYVLAAVSSNTTEELRKVADALGATPINPIKSLHKYVQEDYGMVVENNPLRIRKK